MKNLGYIASEITKGKNLSDNLVKYGKGLSSLYNGCLLYTSDAADD